MIKMRSWNFLLPLLMGVVAYAPGMVYTSGFAMEQDDDGGFNLRMLDDGDPSGLNLQEIVNDQHQRRSRGLGKGFSTDVVGIANNKEMLSRLAQSVNQLNGEIDNLEITLNNTKKSKRKKELRQQIFQLENQRNGFIQQAKSVNEVIKNLKNKVSEASGVDYNKLENIPKMSDMPSQNIMGGAPRMMPQNMNNNIGEDSRQGDLMNELRRTLTQRGESNNNLSIESDSNISG